MATIHNENKIKTEHTVEFKNVDLQWKQGSRHPSRIFPGPEHGHSSPTWKIVVKPHDDHADFFRVFIQLYRRGASSTNDSRRVQIVTATWDVALEVQGLENNVIVRESSHTSTDFHASKQTGVHVKMQIPKQLLLSFKYFIVRVKMTSNSGNLSFLPYHYYSFINFITLKIRTLQV